MLMTLQAMEMVTNADSDADMLPVDSESDDEDLLQPERNPERCDSDDEIPPRERYVISLFLSITYLFGVRLFI